MGSVDILVILFNNVIEIFKTLIHARKEPKTQGWNFIFKKKIGVVRMT